jgi:1-deoxy-D-xylulose-5-phosphate reductoisomerase
LRRGDTAPAVLNAANEIGVQAFLGRRIKFLEIARLVEETLDAAERQGAICPAHSLDDILSVDDLARRLAEDGLNRY